MTQQETETQRHGRLAREAAKRIPESKNPTRTIGTWAKHMKAFIRGAK